MLPTVLPHRTAGPPLVDHRKWPRPAYDLLVGIQGSWLHPRHAEATFLLSAAQIVHADALQRPSTCRYREYIAELMPLVYTQGETASIREVRALAWAHWKSRMRTGTHLDTRERASHVSFREPK